MQSYSPPTEDQRFLLAALGFDQAMAEIGRGEIDAELVMTVLEEAGRLCTDVLAPLNRPGDEQGSHLIDGEVQTPAGFSDAYRQFVAGGWAALSFAPELGGQGLPFLVQLWFDEMMAAANLSFGLFPGLSHNAAEALAAHGSDELRATLLPPLVSGEWTGVMALTEGGAGTDLSLLAARAAPAGDGRYAVTGSKIFISSGDHDFGGNVVHLVLARLPDAAPGVRGISLFACPKYLPDDAGHWVVRNAMSVGALEKKMGIHAQPTCQMNYDGALGWLVGAPGRGLNAMFTMMNSARLMVGMEGLGLASAAYGQAAAYARDRRQGRGRAEAIGPAAIIDHADVRRMLLGIRAFVEGARALAGWVGLQKDRASDHPDPAERARADGFVQLLTPVVKAAFTDMGFEATVQAQQVFGGHGYVREWGMEQFVRDARIAQIYEGTNGVQAMDLAGRKLGLDGGAVARDLFDLIAADLARAADPGAGEIAARTGAALDRLREATAALAGASTDRVGAVATDYLRLFALVALGWMWTRMAAAAPAFGGEAAAAKPAVATFFAARLLPQADALAAAILAADETIVMALPAEAF